MQPNQLHKLQHDQQTGRSPTQIRRVCICGAKQYQQLGQSHSAPQCLIYSIIDHRISTLLYLYIVGVLRTRYVLTIYIDTVVYNTEERVACKRTDPRRYGLLPWPYTRIQYNVVNITRWPISTSARFSHVLLQSNFYTSISAMDSVYCVDSGVFKSRRATHVPISTALNGYLVGYTRYIATRVYAA